MALRIIFLIFSSILLIACPSPGLFKGVYADGQNGYALVTKAQCSNVETLVNIFDVVMPKIVKAAEEKKYIFGGDALLKKLKGRVSVCMIPEPEYCTMGGYTLVGIDGKPELKQGCASSRYIWVSEKQANNGYWLDTFLFEICNLICINNNIYQEGKHPIYSEVCKPISEEFKKNGLP